LVAKRIPGTNRVIFVPAHCGDVEWDMSNFPEVDNSIKQESIPVVGDWEDYTGSGTKTAQMVAMQGSENELQFDLLTQTETPPADLGQFDDRGKRKTTHRSRNKIVSLD